MATEGGGGVCVCVCADVQATLRACEQHYMYILLRAQNRDRDPPSLGISWKLKNHWAIFNVLVLVSKQYITSYGWSCRNVAGPTCFHMCGFSSTTTTTQFAL